MYLIDNDQKLYPGLKFLVWKRISFSSFLFAVLFIMFSGCRKEDVQYYDNDKTILVTNKIIVNNGIKIHDPNLNLQAYEKFLKYLAGSDRFLIVTQKDFDKTNASDKVVLSIRHDIDRNMDGALRMAYREHKYGIKATYFVLHTARFYGLTRKNYFNRNNNVIFYLKKIQDAFGHEIGFHNDLMTLQIVYGIEPRNFLKTELNWLRVNGIPIYGSSMHGSSFCYQYHYLNTYFWKDSPNFGGQFYNYEYLPSYSVKAYPTNEITAKSSFYAQTDFIDKPPIQQDTLTYVQAEGFRFIKDLKENYDLIYDSDYLVTDYNFSDVKMYAGGKRWHMGMEDFDKIPLGKKVIILLHAENWD
jgi:hypothetical protein